MNREEKWLLTEKYQGVESEAFHADCARLRSGEPLAYLIGHAPFLDCTIHLNSHPLIPRPETEFWVEKAISAIKNQSSKRDLKQLDNLRCSTPKILDLCAGSGVIGVAIAKAIPEARVTFTEIDATHLPTIDKNLQKNLGVQYSNRMEYLDIVQSDLFEHVSGTFDFILTNPPYIDAGANTVDLNVATHEPHLALFGGVSGLEIIARIIIEARSFLTPHSGQLWIEHEPFQVEAISELAVANNFHIITHPDQYNVPRFSVLSM